MGTMESCLGCELTMGATRGTGDVEISNLGKPNYAEEKAKCRARGVPVTGEDRRHFNLLKALGSTWEEGVKCMELLTHISSFTIEGFRQATLQPFLPSSRKWGESGPQLPPMTMCSREVRQGNRRFSVA